MSLPRLLYAESYREPLLPLGTRAGGEPLDMSYLKRGEASDADKNDQLELESPSFTTEPFHRFGNAAAAAHRQAAAFPRAPNGGGRDGSSEARLTGGVDGKSDPEVAAYVTKERGGYAGAQFGVIHASGASVGSAVANCGKT